jgi:aminoglycoside 6'-N-acetyltransferase I
MIKKLFLSVFTSDPWNDKWDDSLQLDAYLDELMGNTNSLCYGLFAGESLVGITLGYRFHWWQGTEYEIKEFCIDKALQGKGYGTSFLTSLESELTEQGIRIIWLSTERNVPAYRFYKHLDFHEQDSSVAFTKILKDVEP